jgi:hypothetical protein
MASALREIVDEVSHRRETAVSSVLMVFTQ